MFNNLFFKKSLFQIFSLFTMFDIAKFKFNISDFLIFKMFIISFHNIYSKLFFSELVTESWFLPDP